VRSEEKRTQNQYRRGKLEPETTEHEWLWITTLDKQAFPATLVRRLGSGLQGNGGGGGQVMPWTNPYYDHMIHGLSDFDHKHRIVTSYVWELPFAKRMKGVGAMVLDGWQLTGVQQYQTGSPMTVVSGKDNSLTGLGRDRAISAGADPAVRRGSIRFCSGSTGPRLRRTRPEHSARWVKELCAWLTGTMPGSPRRSRMRAQPKVISPRVDRASFNWR